MDKSVISSRSKVSNKVVNKSPNQTHLRGSSQEQVQGHIHGNICGISPENLSKYLFAIAGLIVAFILVRFISLGLYPLFDTTEARYAEIARIMVETQNWLTPQFDYQQPFWGKPPMHTWLSALSFQALGISELSARLPHFLAGVATVMVLYRFAQRFYSTTIALISALILLSSIGFIIAIGMVMTDAVLTLSVVLAMTSFWQNYQESDSLQGGEFTKSTRKNYSSQTSQKKLAGLLFFVALAMGMLVKGPVAIVIIGIALVTWSIANKCFFKAIKSLPWLSGLTLFIVLAFPWYLMAEAATPGFLEYFLWGEHVQRFLESGWQGDLYGTAHDEVKGTIWFFALAMAFPWSFAALFFITKKLAVKQETEQVAHQLIAQSSGNAKQPLANYLVAWLLAPLLLFTLAGNILPAYVLPALPAFALWLAPKFSSIKVVLLNSVISLCLVVAAIGYASGGFISKTSQVQLLNGFITADSSTALSKAQVSITEVYYWKKRPFSARFYTNGQAQLIRNEAEFNALLAKSGTFLLAGRSRDFASGLFSSTTRCQVVNTHNSYSLYRCD